MLENSSTRRDGGLHDEGSKRRGEAHLDEAVVAGTRSFMAAARRAQREPVQLPEKKKNYNSSGRRKGKKNEREAKEEVMEEAVNDATSEKEELDEDMIEAQQLAERARLMASADKHVPRLRHAKKRAHAHVAAAAAGRGHIGSARRRKAPRVVIVGGGFAGVSAARALMDLGYSVVLLEARQRLGGRVHSTQLGGATVELGAAVLMGVARETRPNPLAALCRKYRLPMHILSQACPLHDIDGKLLESETDKQAEALFNQLLTTAAATRAPEKGSDAKVQLEAMAPGTSVSVECKSSWFDARVVSRRSRAVQVHYLGWKSRFDEWITVPSSRLRLSEADTTLSAALRVQLAASKATVSAAGHRALQWHMANLEFANAANLNAVSAAQWDQDDQYAYEGDHVVLPDGGYGKLLEKLADGIDVRPGVTVTGVETRQTDGSRGGSIRAACSDAEIHVGDALLLTVPLGVLQRLPEDGGLQFSPPLPPAKLDAIRRVGFGSLNKVALVFEEAFWSEHKTDFFGRLSSSSSERGLFFLFFNVHNFCGAPVLLALAAGSAALLLEKLSDEQITARVLKSLRGMFSVVPEPKEVVITRWGEDRFSYGAYSYLSVGGQGRDYAELSEPVGDNLFFAGEHTCEEHPATVVGAYLSGQRAAREIHRALSPAAASSSSSAVPRAAPVN